MQFSAGTARLSPENLQAQRTILIVEDCAEDRQTYRRYLQQDIRYHYQILEAETGDDALSIAAQVKIDVVLLDYCLPDYEGIELLQTLQAQLPHVPILLATGQGTEMLAVQVLKAGAEDYLIKSNLNATELQTAIATAIEKTELRLRIRQGEERERLVAQVSQQIRQSLDLSTILNTTVEAVRQVLQTDRVLIFQMHEDGAGTIIAESVGENWNSVLFSTLTDPCLATTYSDRYQQGRVLAIADIYTADLQPCHIEMLAYYQVRANLVVGILQDNYLWGLLIAQHCEAPRPWQTPEIDLLKQLSVQVGTAIWQAELYRQAQAELQERQRVEAELRESELFKRQILESSYECIKVLDLDGHLLYLNPSGQQQMGICDFSFVEGCQWLEFWQGKDQQAAAIAIAIAKTGGTGKFEGTCPTLSGEIKWWEVQVTPIFDSTGTVERLLAVSRDVSDRKQSELTIKKGSDRIKILYEMTRDLLGSDQPLTLIDTLFHNLRESLELDVYLNYLVDDPERDVDANQMRLASHFGLAEDVATNFGYVSFEQAICGTAAQERHQIILSDVQHDNNPKADLIRALGVTAYAIQPLISQGQLFGTLSFGSKRRTHFTKAETELLQALSDQIAIAIERANLIQSLQKQTEQLQKADRLKDEFLAVLSHELRTPLNPILGWTKLLQDRKMDEARVTEALGTIERNAKLQSQLIEDLLDISRIMRGKLTLNASSVNLAFVISAALETVRLAADAKHVIIVTAIDANVGQVSGDPGRLQQVVWNLLSNAVKFTPQSGQIEVRLTQSDDTHAQIKVIDSGKGINPSFVPHVFDYFRQEDGSTTRKFGGLGLGLAIARQIVELHGGRIWAESEGEGCGATFTVELPALKSNSLMPAVSEPAAPFSTATPLENVRVLVVDDDADSREFISFLLEGIGAIATLCSCAQDALQALEQSPFDILLSDIGMPEIDGYDLIRTLRTSGKTLPAIAITAYAGEVNQQQAIAAGFQRHLSKPLDPDEVIATVNELVTAENFDSQYPITDTLRDGSRALK